MSNSKHSLGGEERRVAPGGVGSSPAASTWPKTNDKTVLRKMLKSRDRQLAAWDTAGDYKRMFYDEYIRAYKKIDAERKLIREKLKRHS